MRIGFSLGTAQPVRDHKAGFQIILERGRAVSQAGLDSLTVRGAVAYGSVGQVVEQLGLLKEQGFGEANLRCMMVEQSDALETIELCGDVKAELA